MHTPTTSHEPEPAAYDAVADLYARAFSDIRVRRDEWRWLCRQLATLRNGKARPDVLDIGCGNGALLRQLAPTIDSGVGVDVSARAIDIANHEARGVASLRFVHITSSALPFADASFDVVTSFLSFRYLDWPRIVPEIQRVLRPDGQLLMIDLVREPLHLDVHELMLLLRSALQHVARPLRNRRFHHDVRALTSHPAWHAMLARHPMRLGREYRACLDAAFPSGAHSVLNVALDKRVIAFNSHPRTTS